MGLIARLGAGFGDDLRLGRGDENERREHVENKGSMAAEPRGGSPEQISGRAAERLEKNVGVLCGGEFGLDEIFHDVSVENDEEEGVEGHDDAKETDGERVRRILAHESGGKRDERLKHEEDGIDPDHAVIGLAGEAEDVVMVEPEFADDDEADEPAKELGKLIEQLMAEFGDAAGIVESGDAEIEDEEGDDNGEDAVTEGFDAVEAKVAAGESLEESHVAAKMKASAGLIANLNYLKV